MGGFLKRMKNLWNKVKNTGKKVLSKIIKITPGAAKALVSIIEVGDGLGIRKVLVNCIPHGVGPVINEVLDVIIECKKRGCFEKITGLLEDLLQQKIKPEKFVELVKDIIGSVIQTVKDKTTLQFNPNVDKFLTDNGYLSKESLPSKLTKVDRGIPRELVTPKIATRSKLELATEKITPEVEERKPLTESFINSEAKEEETEPEPLPPGTSSIFGVPKNAASIASGNVF